MLWWRATGRNVLFQPFASSFCAVGQEDDAGAGGFELKRFEMGLRGVRGLNFG